MVENNKQSSSNKMSPNAIILVIGTIFISIALVLSVAFFFMFPEEFGIDLQRPAEAIESTESISSV